jgi:hypothetical protein
LKKGFGLLIKTIQNEIGWLLDTLQTIKNPLPASALYVLRPDLSLEALKQEKLVLTAGKLPNKRKK